MMAMWNQQLGRRAFIKTAGMAGAVAVGLVTSARTRAFAASERAQAAGATTTGSAPAVPDVAFDQLFERYGDSGQGWAGADSTYSVPLPDGRVVWIFSDTFLGTVNPDHSRPANAPFINNSYIVQQAARLSTLYGGTPSNPASLVSPSANDGSWYWMGDATVEGNSLRQFLLHFQRTGSGIFDFAQIGTDVATFALPDLTLTAISPTAAGFTPTPTGSHVTYGSAIMEDGAYTYLYGVEDLGFYKYCHLARAQAGNVLGPWQFYTGTGWSDDPLSSARLLVGIANEYSVTRTRNGYVLITQDYGIGKNVMMYQAVAPEGPWQSGSGQVVYTTPESGQLGGNLYTYNSHAHPEFSNLGQMLISYDVNSFNVADVYANVDNYRPRFIRAHISV